MSSIQGLVSWSEFLGEKRTLTKTARYMENVPGGFCLWCAWQRMFPYMKRLPEKIGLD